MLKDTYQRGKGTAKENHVSSTAVRRAVKRGMSIKYFVADGVLDYINQQKLYREWARMVGGGGSFIQAGDEGLFKVTPR